MQQIPEQSAVSMFNNPLIDPSSIEHERNSPGSSLNGQFQYYNRYSNASLDSGRGSDSLKVCPKVSVHATKRLCLCLCLLNAPIRAHSRPFVFSFLTAESPFTV